MPEEDDAHVAFLALPGQAAEEDDENESWITEQRKIEDYFMQEMSQLKNYRVGKVTNFPRKFLNSPPDNISKLTDKFLEEYEGELKTDCKITITNPDTGGSRTYDTFWFTPVVVNHLRRVTPPKKGKGPLAGIKICFANTESVAPIQMVMESILTSDDGTDDDGDEVPTLAFKTHNLTPLAEHLNRGISTANTVLREMKYMEGRERRMRQTADSINSRIRSFSYVSVIGLIGVTYLQVTYLKQYFRKKKLM